MNEDMTDYIFPKIAKCQFNYHGPGGYIINADSLCLLPLNVLHEKAFFATLVLLNSHCNHQLPSPVDYEMSCFLL